ncbi:MAG: signal peptide peptidase SppA [Bacteroidales bacterium]|nr:signal peptide peptidase SppA [Bacteroidales bacterium]
MKKFLKMMLAVICGILVLWIIGFTLISLIASAGSKTQSVPAEGILKVDLSKVTIGEQANETFTLGATQATPMGLHQAVKALEAAAEDPGVKALYLKPDGGVLGIATRQELRTALAKFRQSGKPVVAYTEALTTGSIYLASVADKVYTTSSIGVTPTFNGISSQLYFLGDLLDRLGVKVQLIRHGKYKSAGEMYIRSSASPENLHQTQVFINTLWKSFGGEIAASRGLSLEALNKAIDDLELCMPEDFVTFGLADEALDRKGLEEKLAVLAQAESFKDVKMIPFDGYAQKKVKNNFRARGKIAVIYANGEIVEGLDKQNVDGDRFASIIEEVRNDSTVKAVVLRVNSPGGSVSASEKIKTELDLLAGVKPLIASYGDYAASGGYWISNGADKIYSNATTITGSIGVFGMIPDFSKLITENAHVGLNAVSSNKHGDMMSLMRPLSPEEYAYIQRSIEAIYSRFVDVVAEGRDMTPARVDEIAQGRVWAGADALEIGLVDEIGTLEDALAYAAISAGNEDLKAWNIVEYPKVMTFADMFSGMMGGQDEDYSVYLSWYENWKKGKAEYVFASMPFRVTVR